MILLCLEDMFIVFTYLNREIMAEKENKVPPWAISKVSHGSGSQLPSAAERKSLLKFSEHIQPLGHTDLQNTADNIR